MKRLILSSVVAAIISISVWAQSGPATAPAAPATDSGTKSTKSGSHHHHHHHHHHKKAGSTEQQPPAK